MSKHANYTNPRQANGTGINPDDREQMLLDDLRVEVARLADAVERRNELLEEINR